MANRADDPDCDEKHDRGRAHRREQFSGVPDLARRRGPAEINIRFFATGHWLIGMGHDRATSVQSAIGDAIFQMTGKRVRDLPYGRYDLRWR